MSTNLSEVTNYLECSVKLLYNYGKYQEDISGKRFQYITLLPDGTIENLTNNTSVIESSNLDHLPSYSYTDEKGKYKPLSERGVVTYAFPQKLLKKTHTSISDDLYNKVIIDDVLVHTWPTMLNATNYQVNEFVDICFEGNTFVCNHSKKYELEKLVDIRAYNAFKSSMKKIFELHEDTEPQIQVMFTKDLKYTPKNKPVLIGKSEHIIEAVKMGNYNSSFNKYELKVSDTNLLMLTTKKENGEKIYELGKNKVYALYEGNKMMVVSPFDQFIVGRKALNSQDEEITWPI